MKLCFTIMDKIYVHNYGNTNEIISFTFDLIKKDRQ